MSDVLQEKGSSGRSLSLRLQLRMLHRWPVVHQEGGGHVLDPNIGGGRAPDLKGSGR